MNVPCLLIFEFFPNHTDAYFLITCTEIYDLDTNIPISKFH